MASRVYNDYNLKQGRLLASGRGSNDMLGVCYRNKWTEENTILVVEDINDLNSKWKIYEGRK